MPLLDEPSVLEFERLCNQANSLEREQTDLGLACQKRRSRYAAIAVGAGVLAGMAVLVALAVGESGWLMASAAGLIVVSIFTGLKGGFGTLVDREIQHFVRARELVVFRETCQLIVAEHESGKLKRPDFRTRLAHHTAQFKDLSASLEHPYR